MKELNGHKAIIIKELRGNKSVIMIKGDHTKWYEQALFVVKKNLTKREIPFSLIQEAEETAAAHMPGAEAYDRLETEHNPPEPNAAPKKPKARPGGKSARSKKRDCLGLLLNISLLLAFGVFTGYLLYLFFG